MASSPIPREAAPRHPIVKYLSYSGIHMRPAKANRRLVDVGCRFQMTSNPEPTQSAPQHPVGVGMMSMSVCCWFRLGWRLWASLFMCRKISKPALLDRPIRWRRDGPVTRIVVYTFFVRLVWCPWASPSMFRRIPHRLHSTTSRPVARCRLPRIHLVS